MKLHFCEAIEIENLREVESERKQKQQDQIALFEKKSFQRDLPKKIQKYLSGNKSFGKD